MAPSQLKSLKASLRQQGILGPQPSKKEKQRGGKSTVKQRQRRADALADIRERFNPFEVKKLSRGVKHEFANGSPPDAVLGRPGVTKGLGEEARRNTLLKEMQRRQKVGGMVDRRFGENDPTMTPEDRALQRFLHEKQSQNRKASMFDLEDDADDDGLLTHNGRSLGLAKGPMKGPAHDDFDATGLGESDDDADGEDFRRAQKRQRLGDEDQDPVSFGSNENRDDAENRPKTKKEVMREVIAKSKLHRYERQKAKDDDEDLREQLDAGLHNMLTALRGNGDTEPTRMEVETRIEPAINPDRAALLAGKDRDQADREYDQRLRGNGDTEPTRMEVETRIEPAINPDRAALLAGKDRDQADREYDQQLRQLAQEARAQPTTRSKTEDEKAQEEAQRLQDLEEKRLRRMRGESVSDEEADVGGDYESRDEFEEENILGKGVPIEASNDLGVEDEDDFVLEKDLVAEGSDLEFESLSESGDETDGDDSEDQEFVAGLLSEEDAGRIKSQPAAVAPALTNGTGESSALAFTYACPETHEELLEVTRGTAYEDLHTIIQRIRALYHSRLAEENKHKLATFATVLVQHLPYLAEAKPRPTFTTLEALIRHIHSLAKTYPTEVSLAYREHLQFISSKRPLDLTGGDLVLLIGISTTFSTSDHFHPVATPAMMTLTRAIGQKIPRSLAELVTGIFACTLCLQYQRLSKRYVPEVTNYLLNALSILAPTPRKQASGPYPTHASSEEMRISTDGQPPPHYAGRLQFFDVEHATGTTPEDVRVKQGLLATTLHLITMIASLWEDTSSFPEIFRPFVVALAHLARPANSKYLARSIATTQIPALQKTLASHIAASLGSRKPLALHHHRPLPIKTSIPKFEVDFHPDKHYDADEQRAASARLRKEHRRERKGAVRELRKDGAFVAREELREKITREREQKDKERRVIAQIQTQEGGESNRYQREKKLRLGKR